MSRESKIMQVNVNMQNEIVHAYESFGWELLGVNGTQISLSRETQNPVYSDLLKYQIKYEELSQKKEELINELRRLPKLNNPGLFTYFLLFVLFVFPLVLYLYWRHDQKTKYNSKVAELEYQISGIKEEIQKVLDTSRATFFSRQQSL